MKSAAKHSVLVTLGLLESLFLLFGLAGCDGFLVSICNFDDKPGCPRVGTDGVMKPMADMIPQSPDRLPPRNGAERSFKSQMTIPFEYKRKFVGIYDKDKLLLITNPPNSSPIWEALTMTQPAAKCMDCPEIPKFFSFTGDSIYISGGSFYFLQYINNINKIWKLEKNRPKVSFDDIKLNQSSSRSFVHPITEALVISTQDSDPNKFQATAIIDGNSSYTISTNEMSSDFFSIGDIDSNDITKNGSEIIFFTAQGPSELRHQMGLTSDPSLLNALKITIDETKIGNGILQAAFVDSLNDDAFPDLIYARNGKVYVTSYKGRNWSGMVPIFEQWNEPVITISGETVKSIIAAELTKDSYPEIVIETDKAVHVYQNIPKAGS